MKSEMKESESNESEMKENRNISVNESVMAKMAYQHQRRNGVS
jgi:hypothetical protein